LARKLHKFFVWNEWSLPRGKARAKTKNLLQGWRSWTKDYFS